MPYYLSYVVKKDWTPWGHSTLMVTKHEPPNLPEVIRNFGFTSDGFFEDDLTEKRGVYLHKTYPITDVEYQKFEAITKSHKEGNQYQFSSAFGGKYSIHKEKLKYNVFNFNCKTYALSVMRELGILDDTLVTGNLSVDVPRNRAMSATLSPLTMITKEGGYQYWKSPLVVSKRLNEELF